MAAMIRFMSRRCYYHTHSVTFNCIGRATTLDAITAEGARLESVFMVKPNQGSNLSIRQY